MECHTTLNFCDGNYNQKNPLGCFVKVLNFCKFYDSKIVKTKQCPIAQPLALLDLLKQNYCQSCVVRLPMKMKATM